jgi:predicted PhzF superfamily epimerase YddE/YHI9
MSLPRLFAGNPLAVVMGADYRVRVFVPAAEIPFVGHPSVVDRPASEV